MIKPHGRMKGKGYEMKNVLECIIRLLPVEKEDTVPVSLLFGRLRCAFTWNVGKECRFRLEIRIAGQLEQAMFLWVRMRILSRCNFIVEGFSIFVP